MRPKIISLVALSLLSTLAQPIYLAGTPAVAQSTGPSAEQIIKSLTPTGDMTGSLAAGGRGIRPSVSPKETRSNQGQDKSAIVKVTTSAALPSEKPAEGPPAAAAPSIDLNINFTIGSADLTPEAIRTLDALGTALGSPALASYRFRIEGHTDTVGTRDFNRMLSQQRADAVVRYMGIKFGLAMSRMEPIGVGSEELLIPTPEQVAEPRNRRVRIVNLGS